MTSTEPRGCLPSAIAWLIGPRAERLSEHANRSHWLSYLLIISQSIAVVLVFGHAEVGLLFSPDFAIRLPAMLALFVLIITVIAADLAMLETLTRAPALARNRQTMMLVEHVAYVVFVMAVEGATYGVVLYTLDGDPQALVRNAPLIPTAGAIFLALVGMRVVLICWSAVQLIVVRGKLPVLLSTLMNTGKELVGAHIERQIATMDISHVEMHELFGVYARMAQPPRPIPGLWNLLLLGWPQRHALAQEAEEERQAAQVREALATLTHRSSPQEDVSAEDALARVRRDLHIIYPLFPDGSDAPAATGATSDDFPPDGPGGGMPANRSARAHSAESPHASHAPQPQAATTVASADTRRPRPAAIRSAVRRREKSAARALEHETMLRAFVLLDATPSLSANALMQALQALEFRIGHRKAKRYIEQWKVARSAHTAVVRQAEGA